MFLCLFFTRLLQKTVPKNPDTVLDLHHRGDKRKSNDVNKHTAPGQAYIEVCDDSVDDKVFVLNLIWMS